MLLGLGRYKIFFYLEAFVRESIIRLPTLVQYLRRTHNPITPRPPLCVSYTIQYL